MGANESTPLGTASRAMILVVGSIFLLRELGEILKPLCLAVLLGYVILPIHYQVKKRVPGRLSFVASGILTLLAIILLTAVIQSSVRTLAAEVPILVKTTQDRLGSLNVEFAERYPAMWERMSELSISARDGEGAVRGLTTRLLGAAADTVSTGAVVGLYLMFLLLEAGRFPDRVRKAFSATRAERIMTTIGGINRGITDFLVAKVKASLMLAIPVFVLLIVFRMPFPLLWTVLTFFCNFVPYLGSAVAFGLPTLYVGYNYGLGWESITIVVLLLAIHVITASVIEPAVIGRAVGVSTVVILFALAFWGYCWGLTGMLVAVPITVMMKIVFEHIESTRPFAELVSDQ